MDTPCIEGRGHTLDTGYKQTWCPRRKKVISEHRLTWMNAYGPIPEGMVVRHKCDNRTCVNIDHLELGTQKDNVRDMFERGRAPDRRGSKAPIAKLTDEQVVEIRAALSAGVLQKTLAARYGVSKNTISQIKLRKRYTNV